jgi:hypothetical protein
MKTSYSYKWPTIKQGSNVQQALLNKQTQQEVETSPQTLGIGITTVIFYFLTFIYIYGSGAINNNNITSFESFKNKVITSIKDLTIFNLNTLSSSFEKSERIGTTMCLIVFLALLQSLFSYQNIYSNDMKRAPIVAFNYVIILCWLLFLYIFPSNKDSKGTKTSIGHLLLAICVLISVIINCFLVANLYSDYFSQSDIEPLTGIGYALVLVALVSGIGMMFNGKYNTTFTHSFVAYTEMGCLVLFGIFLIIFIQFPPLPSDQLSCVLIPHS